MELESVPSILPKPGVPTPRAAEAARVWGVFVPRLLHPVKLAVVEALLWVREPMSATGLAAMLEEPAYSGGVISYHLRVMAEAGVVVRTGHRAVRGAEELFFYFPQVAEDSDRSPSGAGEKQ